MDWDFNTIHKLEPPENKYILVEFLYDRFQMSAINNNEYTIIKDCSCLMEIGEILNQLNKDYHQLILDVGRYYQPIVEEIFEKFNLNYSIEKISREQGKIMNRERWSLIGFYIYTRRLIRNNSIVSL